MDAWFSRLSTLKALSKEDLHSLQKNGFLVMENRGPRSPRFSWLQDLSGPQFTGAARAYRSRQIWTAAGLLSHSESDRIARACRGPSGKKSCSAVGIDGT